jgi:PAS domain S-box-containing protein
MDTSIKHNDAARKRLEAALDTVDDAVITIDRDFTITCFNRAAEELTGRPRGLVLGKPCYDVFRSPACRSKAKCPMMLALHTETGLSMREMTLRSIGGEEHHVRMSFTPLRNDAGTITGGVETLRRRNGGSDEFVVSSASKDMSPLDQAERQAIETILRRNHWNRTAASRELGISRITLWRKMRRLGIEAN